MTDARPNILLILTDEQRFDQLGCVNPVVKTPHLDALAADGVLFERAYTTSPSCVPARASLMSGKYPSQCGAPMYVTYLPSHETTFMSRLREAGYHTAVVGKQHFGKSTIEHGYDDEEIIDAHFAVNDLAAARETNTWFADLADRGIGGLADLAEPLFPYVMDWKADESLHVDSFVGERALRWLREDRPTDKPWFFCASFPGPHMPFDGLGLPQADRYDPTELDMPQTTVADLDGKPDVQRIAHGTTEPGTLSDEQIRQARHSCYANVSLIDDQIGRLVADLKAEGLYEQTLILVASDHGDYLGDFGKLGKSQCLLEVLMRIPMIAKPPADDTPSNQIQGKCESSFVNLVDIASTCLAAAKAPAPPDCPGIDLARYWQSPKDLNDRAQIYMEAGRMRGLRRGDWKITHYFERDYGELYDLAADPWEKHNLWDAPEHRAQRDELRLALLDEVIRLSPRHESPWNDSSTPPSPEI